MKRLVALSAAAFLAVALPASAGVSLDRVSPSVGGCPFPVSFSHVLSLVPFGGGCDVAGGLGPVREIPPISFGLGAMDNMDALSANTHTSSKLSYHLMFSADRASVGQPASPYNAEAANNQAASDLWRTSLTAGSPAGAMSACAPVLIPTPPHVLHRNQTAFNLGRTAAPGVAVAPPQDNVDGVEMDVLDIDANGIHDFDVYFSLDAASPALFASGADIYFSPAGGGPFFIFSFPPQIGLVAGDELDALVMWDRGVIGAPDPGIDFALFSLAPGSPSLGAASAASIFVTDFNFAFCPFAQAGLLGMQAADNVDGLDVVP